MLQLDSKNTWSSALTGQLAVEPAQGEGRDVDRVVRVGDRQLGGVGYVRAGRGPHGPGEVAVAGMSRREVVVLVLTRALLQAALAVALGVREALTLLLVVDRAFEQGDALVLLAVHDLVAEGGVLLTADAAQEGGGWVSTWWGSRHLLSSSPINPNLVTPHFQNQSFVTVTNLSRLCCMSRVTGCPSVRVGEPPGDYCPSRWAGPGSHSWRAGFSEPVLPPRARAGILYRPARCSTDPLTTVSAPTILVTPGPRLSNRPSTAGCYMSWVGW